MRTLWSLFAFAIATMLLIGFISDWVSGAGSQQASSAAGITQEFQAGKPMPSVPLLPEYTSSNVPEMGMMAVAYSLPAISNDDAIMRISSQPRLGACRIGAVAASSDEQLDAFIHTRSSCDLQAQHGAAYVLRGYIAPRFPGQMTIGLRLNHPQVSGQTVKCSAQVAFVVHERQAQSFGLNAQHGLAILTYRTGYFAIDDAPSGSQVMTVTPTIKDANGQEVPVRFDRDAYDVAIGFSCVASAGTPALKRLTWEIIGELPGDGGVRVIQPNEFFLPSNI